MPAPDPTPITAAEFARELVKMLGDEVRWSAKRRKAATKDTSREFYRGRQTGCAIFSDMVRDLAAKHGIKLEGGE